MRPQKETEKPFQQPDRLKERRRKNAYRQKPVPLLKDLP
jgi:hypothetical protein